MSLKADMRLAFLLLMGLLGTGAAQSATLTLSPPAETTGIGSRPTRVTGAELPHSLADAQKKWRALKLAPGEAVEVVMRGGNYPLDDTLHIGVQDPPLHFKAVGAQKPRIVASSKATGWRQETWNGHRAFIADFASDEPLQALYVNGARATRARWPKTGTLKLKDTGSNGRRGWGEEGTDHFTVDPTDWAAMGDASGAEVVALHFWVESRLPVQSFDAQSGEVISSRKTVAPLDWGYKGEPAPYYVENARGALREAGEWIHDLPNHRLIYLPRPGETLANTRLNAPLLAQLVRIDGEDNQKIGDIRFDNIAFGESAAPMPFPAKTPPEKAPAGSGQAAVDVGGAIEVSRAHNVAFANCEFSGLGWYGLQVSDGSDNISVDRCRFFDLGAGGLVASGYDANGPLNLRSSALQIRDCTFQKGGRVWPSAVAVLLRHMSDCVVSHNSISDFFYTGISCGWSWGYGPSVSKNNLISNNHIWNIGQGVLSDMGGIYLLGLAPGTRVENNWIHDVQSANYGGWGIYLDEGSSDVVVRNNVVARCTSNAFHQHYGQNNRIENNIFVGGGNSVIARTRVEDHLSFSFAHNILVSSGPPIYLGQLPDAAKNLELNDNLLWNQTGAVKATGNDDWAAWQGAGRDTNSRIADPLFADIAHDNFDLKPNSPALAMGFTPWKWRDVGPRP